MPAAISSTSLYPGFTRLSPNIHILAQSSSSSSSAALVPETPDHPALLILCTWMDAPSKLITKYLSEYLRLYPRSSILLATCSLRDMFLASNSTLDAHFAPGAEFILSITQSSSREAARTSIVSAAYSNGGVASLNRLARLYRARTQHPLSLSSTLLDSAPGSNSLSSGHGAIMASLPARLRSIAVFRIIISLLLWASLYLWKTYILLVRAETVITRLRNELHDPTLYDPQARRVYVYSKEDKIVSWRGVVSSAEESRRGGWQVQVDEFRGSRHVAHAVLDKERYWGIVGNL